MDFSDPFHLRRCAHMWKPLFLRMRFLGSFYTLFDKQVHAQTNFDICGYTVLKLFLKKGNTNFCILRIREISKTDS